MAFRRIKGKTKLVQLPVTPSTVLAKDSLVAFSSGYLIAATNSSEGYDIAGVIRQAVAATDSDYASARSVTVEVPVEANVTWEFDVTSGLVAADIGTYVELTDASTVNRAGTTLDIVQPTKVISSTKGQGYLLIGIYGRRKAAS